MTIILAVDPGSRITGYALIRVIEGREPDIIDFGCIRPPQKALLPEKYAAIFDSLSHLIERHTPQALVVETQFFFKNAKSALVLGMVRGLVLLLGGRYKIPLYEYAPKKAKLAVVGNGAASKQQVQRMIQLLLRLPQPPQPEDAADALALALCHAHTLKVDIAPAICIENRLKRTQKPIES